MVKYTVCVVLIALRRDPYYAPILAELAMAHKACNGALRAVIHLTVSNVSQSNYRVNR